MKRFSVSDYLKKLQTVVVRFTFPFFFVIGLSVLFFININKDHADIQERLWAFFGVGIPMSLMISVFAENFKNLLLRTGMQLAGVILLILHVLFLPEKILTFQIIQLIALGGSAAIAFFAVSFYKKDDAVSFWEFSKTSVVQLITSGIFAVVLMLGLSLAILSLQELFKIKIEDEVYQNLAVICFSLFLPVYFLANIPEGTEKFKTVFHVEKFIKILALYIILPILIIYTTILYVYLIQIVVKWELPEGWVSWLVTVLALAGFITLMLQYPLRVEKQKTAVFFAKYFPLILLPLIVLMSVGIFKRLSDYGLTINRAYVLVFNVWLYGISIFLLITQSRRLKYIIFSFVVIAVIASVGPWSVFDITRRSLVNETNKMLTSLNYLENGLVKDTAKLKLMHLNDSTTNPLQEKITYLVLNYGTVSVGSFFKDDVSKEDYSDICERLNFKNCNSLYQTNRFYNFRLDENSPNIDIRDYSKAIRVVVRGNDESNTGPVQLNSKSNLLIIQSDSAKYQISLNNLLEKLTELNSVDNQPVDVLSLKTKDYYLLIENIDFKKRGTFEVFMLRGWLFIK